MPTLSRAFVRCAVVITVVATSSADLPLVLPRAAAAPTSAAETAARMPVAASIVAAAVRRRGQVCAGPVEATPESGPIKAHRKSWRLACRDAIYRVTFVLDRMVGIERLD